MTVKVQLPGQISVTRLGHILSLWKIHEGLYSFSKKKLLKMANYLTINLAIWSHWTEQTLIKQR